MSYRSRCALLGVAALLASASMTAGAQMAAGSFERTLTVGGPVELEVHSGAGSVTITRGTADRVHVVGRVEVHGRRFRGADDAEEIVRGIEDDPPIEVRGNRIRLGDPDERDDWRGSGVVISYDIRAPERTSLTSRTGSGSQELSGLAGPVDAAAGSGTLVVSDLGGPVSLGTGSGSIRGERIAGAINARAGSGSIRLAQSAPGDVEIRTGSGSIELSGIDGALEARAGSGRVTVAGRPSGRWSIGTGSGSIRLALPEDAGFDLEAGTGSGRIHTEHPITLEGSIDRHHLNGRVRGGGPLVHLRTGSGSIRID